MRIRKTDRNEIIMKLDKKRENQDYGPGPALREFKMPPPDPPL